MILTIFSAILTCLILPKTYFFWLAYVCLVPLLYVIDKTSSKRTLFFYGLLYGFIIQGYFHLAFFALKVWAPVYGLFIVWFFYSLYLALFYAVCFSAFGYIRKHRYFLLLLPALWIVFEWLRSFGPIGNTSVSLGFSQAEFLPILQMASIIGLYGISFYLVLINILVYKFINIGQSSRKKIGISLILLIIIPIAWGLYRLNTKESNLKEYKVAVIQGNHPQLIKQNKKNWNKIRQEYMTLSQKVAKKDIDIIFWPETFIPALNTRNKKFIYNLSSFTKKNNVSVIFGTPIHKNKKFYNGIAVVNPSGLSQEFYLKNMLMPLGEYIPLRSAFQKIGIAFTSVDYSSDKKYNLLKVNGINLGGGICLESFYQSHYSQLTKNGADLLCVLVNNAWFFNSPAPYEHFQMSILRAVENNRYLIQAANTGISAIIDNKGRVLKKAGMDQRKTLTAKVYTGHQNALFQKTKNLIIYLSIFLILIFL